MQEQSMAYMILYVKDQNASSRFYEAVLGEKPALEVPGMTEFRAGDQTILGLMPESGISRLLGFSPEDISARGVRGEIYLSVPDPEMYFQRSLMAGAKMLSPLAARDWGDRVAYSLDLDGYVLAFAHPMDPPD